MAQSRLEKIGTIYDRVTSLIKAGAMKEDARPFWVNIYKAFPPKYEPRYDRPGSSAPIRQIFYPEDRLRARFHKEYKHFSIVNVADNKAVSRTEQFLTIYKHLQKTGTPEPELYDKALEEFLAKFNAEYTERKAKAEARKAGGKPKRDSDAEQMAASESTELTEEEKETYRPVRLSMQKLEEVMKLEDKKPEDKKPE